MAITQIASLSDVKAFMRIPNPTQANADDAIITDMMAAAQAVVERELGRIVSKKITGERFDGGNYEIYLRELPVLYVTNVQEGWGYYDQNLNDQEVNQIPALSIWAYSLDNPKEGIVTRRAAGNVNVPFVRGRNNIRVDYVSGRSEMPANAPLAFKELVSYWYRNTQLRAVNSAGTLGSGAQTAFGAVNTDFTRSSGETSTYAGVPEGVLLLLRPGGRRPIIG